MIVLNTVLIGVRLNLEKIVFGEWLFWLGVKKFKVTNWISGLGLGLGLGNILILGRETRIYSEGPHFLLSPKTIFSNFNRTLT